MTRNMIVVSGVIAAILAYVTMVGRNREAIEQARSEAARMESQRDSLFAAVQGREAEQAGLAEQAVAFESQATRLRDSVDALERNRLIAELSARENRTRADPFGPLGPPGPLGQPCIIDHQNAESWRAQRDQLLALDSLRVADAALQDSIARILSANATTWRAGYDSVYAGYQDLSGKYVAELKKPRIRLGFALHLFAAVGAGLVLGVAIR